VLDLARQLEWDFPSSAGRPLRDPAQAEPLLSRRDELVEAARQLDDGQAAELAGRTWRLWMAARDIPGGREFLAPVLECSGSTTTRDGGTRSHSGSHSASATPRRRHSPISA
jgi:hypothetical protein